MNRYILLQYDERESTALVGKRACRIKREARFVLSSIVLTNTCVALSQIMGLDKFDTESVLKIKSRMLNFHSLN